MNSIHVTIWNEFVHERTTPEYATFANAVMVRYLDMNDTYPGEGGGHPSDMLAAFIACGETCAASGMDVVRAMHVAYEVFGSLGDVVPLRRFGWDPGTFLQVGVAAGVSNLLNLDDAATANAIAIAITPNMPMSVGFPLYGSLSQATSSGRIPYPARGEDLLGNHAVVAVGYDDRIKVRNTLGGEPRVGAFLIQQSWGKEWGEDGFGWLPYDFVLRDKAHDFWTLTRAEWVDTGAFQLDV